MTQGNQRKFETHFERAARLGITPVEVKNMALAFKLGNFGSLGGVVFFPADGRDMSFFEKLILARYP